MKEWLEYKLSKRQLLVYLIVYFLMIAFFGGAAIYLFFSSIEHGKNLSLAFLIPLSLSSLIIIPIIIMSIIDLYRIKSIYTQCEYYIVQFEDLHSYLHGYYFSLKILKNSGEIIHGDTRPMFRRYGLRSYENFINKRVRIAVSQNSKIVVVGIENTNSGGVNEKKY